MLFYRYRKSMDEMQKKMEKKLSMLSKNSKLLTKVVRVASLYPRPNKWVIYVWN